MIPRGRARAPWRDPCATLPRVRWLIVLPFARPGLMGVDFGDELTTARPRGPALRLPARQSPLQEHADQGRLPALDPAPARARGAALPARRRAGDQGRTDHARARATDQGAARRRLRQLLSRQPAVDDPVRVHRGLRPVLHQGALRHAQPPGRRPSQPALPADVLRAGPAPSGQPDARPGRAFRRSDLAGRQPLRLPRAPGAGAGRLPAPCVGRRLDAGR